MDPYQQQSAQYTGYGQQYQGYATQQGTTTTPYYTAYQTGYQQPAYGVYPTAAYTTGQSPMAATAAAYPTVGYTGQTTMTGQSTAPNTVQGNIPATNPLGVDQKKYTEQLQEWQKQYDEWLKKNKDHPDQKQFQQWQQQMKTWQDQFTQALPTAQTAVSAATPGATSMQQPGTTSSGGGGGGGQAVVQPQIGPQVIPSHLQGNVQSGEITAHTQQYQMQGQAMMPSYMQQQYMTQQQPSNITQSIQYQQNVAQSAQYQNVNQQQQQQMFTQSGQYQNPQQPITNIQQSAQYQNLQQQSMNQNTQYQNAQQQPSAMGGYPTTTPNNRPSSNEDQMGYQGQNTGYTSDQYDPSYDDGSQYDQYQSPQFQNRPSQGGMRPFKPRGQHADFQPRMPQQGNFQRPQGGPPSRGGPQNRGGPPNRPRGFPQRGGQGFGGQRFERPQRQQNPGIRPLLSQSVEPPFEMGRGDMSTRFRGPAEQDGDENLEEPRFQPRQQQGRVRPPHDQQVRGLRPRFAQQQQNQQRPRSASLQQRPQFGEEQLAEENEEEWETRSPQFQPRGKFGQQQRMRMISQQKQRFQRPQGQQQGPQMTTPQNQQVRQPGPRMTPPQNQGQRMTPPQNQGQRMTPPQNQGQRMNTPQNQGQRMNTPQNQGQRMNTPQNQGQRMTTPQNQGQRMTTPQNQGQRMNTPQNQGQRMNTPQNQGQRMNTPQNQGQRMNTPQNQGQRMTPPQNQGQKMTPQNQGPRMNTPQNQGQRMNTPQNQGQKMNTPQNQGQRMNTPQNQGQRMNTPQNQGQRMNTPQNQGQRMNTPQNQGQRMNTPQNQGQRMNTPQNQGPRMTPPQNHGPRMTPPQNQGPRMTPPQSQGSRMNTPQNQGLRMNPPQNQGLLMKTPQNQGPRMTPPQNQGPRMTPPQSQGLRMNTPQNQGLRMTPPPHQEPRMTPPQNQGPRMTPPQHQGPGIQHGTGAVGQRAKAPNIQDNQMSSPAPRMNATPPLRVPNQSRFSPAKNLRMKATFAQQQQQPPPPQDNKTTTTPVSQQTATTTTTTATKQTTVQQTVKTANEGAKLTSSIPRIGIATSTTTTSLNKNEGQIPALGKPGNVKAQEVNRNGKITGQTTDANVVGTGGPLMVTSNGGQMKNTSAAIEIEVLRKQQEQLNKLKKLGMLQKTRKEVDKKLEEVESDNKNDSKVLNMVTTTPTITAAPNTGHITTHMTDKSPVEPVTTDKVIKPGQIIDRRPAHIKTESKPVQKDHVPCPRFPNCTIAEDCEFHHPYCRYDERCKRNDCRFYHTVPITERLSGKSLRPLQDEERLGENYRDYPPDYRPEFDDRHGWKEERRDVVRSPPDNYYDKEQDDYNRDLRLDLEYRDDYDRDYPLPRDLDDFDRQRYDNEPGDRHERLPSPMGLEPRGYDIRDERLSPPRDYDVYRDDVYHGPRDPAMYERDRGPHDRYPERDYPGRGFNDAPYFERDRRDIDYDRRRGPYNDPYYNDDPLFAGRPPHPPYDDRPHPPYDDRPPIPFNDRPRPPFDDRPPPPFDDRPPPPFDDRPPPPFDDRPPPPGYYDRRPAPGFRGEDVRRPRDFRRFPDDRDRHYEERETPRKSYDYNHGDKRPDDLGCRNVPENPKPKPKMVAVDTLLDAPGRENRPDRIVFIFRGVPGSGKTHIARLIKEKETACGAPTPRILSLDDYFLQETIKREKDPETGKKIEVKSTEYIYEEELEESYRNSLFKSFNKTLDDGFFPMVMLDCVNDKVEHFERFWSQAKQKGFEVYIAEITTDPADCAKRNTHHRTLEEINALLDRWEETPFHHTRLDVRSLLQDAAITEVEMETIEESGANNEGNADKSDNGDEDEQEDELAKSRWNDIGTELQLDKLDGLRIRSGKRKAHGESPPMEDEEDDPYDEREEDMRLGKKRVRWADIEERKHLEHRRKIGFCIGTDWSLFTNPNAEIPK